MKSEEFALTENIRKNEKKWAVTLCCEEEEKLEIKVANIVEYLAKIYGKNRSLVISYIDATGLYGDALTRRGNEEGSFNLSFSEMLRFLTEEGQVIELEATLIKNEIELFKIIVRDGVSIDVLGSGELLPLSILGKYLAVEPTLFLW